MEGIKFKTIRKIYFRLLSKNLSIGIALALSVFSGSVVLGIVCFFMVQMPLLSFFYKFIRKEEQEFGEKFEREKKKMHPISGALKKIRRVGSSFKKLKNVNF